MDNLKNGYKFLSNHRERKELINTKELTDKDRGQTLFALWVSWDHLWFILANVFGLY